MFIEGNLNQFKTPQSVPKECVREVGISFGGDR
jgi:hypothetical protein